MLYWCKANAFNLSKSPLRRNATEKAFSITLVGGISQMVPLGSLTQVRVFKLQQVVPAQSIRVNIGID